MNGAVPNFLLGIACGIGLCLVMSSCVGKDEVEVERDQYCRQVRDGYWPDYRGTYREECGGKDPPKFNADLTK